MNKQTVGIALGVILLLLLFGLYFNWRTVTGAVTAVNTTSEVTISAYFSLELCTELATKIDFGTVAYLPNYTNATKNFNDSDMTEYCVNISADANKPVNLNVSAQGDLTSNGNSIDVSTNYTLNDSNISWNDADYPSNTSATYLQEYPVWTAARRCVPVGEWQWFRFWLNLPGAPAPIPVGTYDNNVTFKGDVLGC